MNSVQSGPTVQIERDFYGWCLDQASALRKRRASSLDWEHLAEELETMGAQEKREVKKELKRLLVHLLKMRHQSTELRGHHSWRKTIREAREEIADLLDASPGLFAGKRDEFLKTAYERARVQASDDTRLPPDSFPPRCQWSYEQIMRDDFFPGQRR
jgi:hypothetical protein